MLHKEGPVIACDLDGVLGNITQQLVRFSDKEYQLRLRQKHFVSENIETCTPITLVQLRRLFETPNFFQTLPAVRGAGKWLGTLRSAGCNIVIVTDRFWYQGIQEDTTDWLKNHGIPYDTVVFARKSEKQTAVLDFGIEWFIEDQLSNARLLSAVCQVILLDRPYNQGDLPSHVTRVKNMQQAVGQIRFSTRARSISAPTRLSF